MTTKKTSLPTWDLSDLYVGLNDPKLERDMSESRAQATAFEKKFRGKINGAKLATETLRRALQSYETILLQASKPPLYAALVHSTMSDDHAAGRLYSRTNDAYTDIAKRLLFLELELLSHSSAELERLAHDQKLTRYRHFLERLAKTKPHRLSENEEKILADKSLTGRQAFARLFEQEAAAKSFELTQRGKTKKLTQSAIIELLNHADRETRRAAAKGITRGLKSDLTRNTYIYNTLVRDKMSDDRIRHFARPEDARHLENETTTEAVDALTQTVRDGYRHVSDYYAFKGKLLKLKKLYDYDRYAPLDDSSPSVPFDQARRIILEAFGRFSPVFEKQAAEFFDKRWIDAPAKIGKRGGAYCMFVTPDLHPYVFVNYQSRVKDVLTLAHELGHAIHACLARQQSYLHFDWPLTIAETASIFGEMLVFDHLKETLTDPKQRLALYLSKIEDTIASVFREATKYSFELDVHRAVKEKGELSPDEIGKLWNKRQQEVYGQALTITPDYACWWSYVTHFIESPFYVYAYAFGELLSLSLYARYKQDGQKTVAAYLAMLSAGGSKSPDELVKAFGIDLKDKNFWRGGINIIEEMIREAKRLAKEV